MVINEHHRLGIPKAGGGSRILELPLGDPWGQSPVRVPTGFPQDP